MMKRVCLGFLVSQMGFWVFLVSWVFLLYFSLSLCVCFCICLCILCVSCVAYACMYFSLCMYNFIPLSLCISVYVCVHVSFWGVFLVDCDLHTFFLWNGVVIVLGLIFSVIDFLGCGLMMAVEFHWPWIWWFQVIGVRKGFTELSVRLVWGKRWVVHNIHAPNQLLMWSRDNHVFTY